LAAVFFPYNKSVEGAAPRLFRPMYAEANMGHPSRGEGSVFCANHVKPKRNCSLKMKTIPNLPINLARIVVVKATKRKAVIQ
jgi:hypothetical protein